MLRASERFAVRNSELFRQVQRHDGFAIAQIEVRADQRGRGPGDILEQRDLGQHLELLRSRAA